MAKSQTVPSEMTEVQCFLGPLGHRVGCRGIVTVTSGQDVCRATARVLACPGSVQAITYGGDCGFAFGISHVENTKAERFPLRLCGLGNGTISRLDAALLLLGEFDSEFLGYDLLQLLRVHPVPFGGAHKNVVAACGGSLISRIQ